MSPATGLANAVAAAGTLALMWRSAKALQAPVVVAIDRIEDRLQQQAAPPASSSSSSAAPPPRRRRQTMSAAQATRLYVSSQAASLELLKAWVLVGLLTAAAAVGLPYAAELRAVLVVVAAVGAAPAATAPRAAVDRAFRALAPPVLGRAVPRALRWARRQVRAALWWAPPLARTAAGALVPPAAVALLSDAGEWAGC
jgi:threonine dehydrogenase-like Zn-dependent dehydrogenase